MGENSHEHHIFVMFPFYLVHIGSPPIHLYMCMQSPGWSLHQWHRCHCFGKGCLYMHLEETKRSQINGYLLTKIAFAYIWRTQISRTIKETLDDWTWQCTRWSKLYTLVKDITLYGHRKYFIHDYHAPINDINLEFSNIQRSTCTSRTIDQQSVQHLRHKE